MTEQEYLCCDSPIELLTWMVGRGPSGRRLRLYACAVVRAGLPYESCPDRANKVLRSAEAAEAAIDGGDRHPVMEQDAAKAAWTELEIVVALHPALRPRLAALARDIFGPFRSPPRECCAMCFRGTVPTDRDDNTCEVCGGTGWRFPRAWSTPAAIALARAAYSERLLTGFLDPFRLGLVADALEEARCDDEPLLSHLRGWEACPGCGGRGGCCDLKDEISPWGPLHRCVLCKGTGRRPLPGPHARGCAALDAVLERS